MSVPYTDSEASEARQWSNRYGPPNAWTASLGTAARMIGRLLDERERLMADAMLREREQTNLDAAPAARASVESVAPQPTTRGDSDRTDKAAPRPSEGTGDTPDSPQPIACSVFDRSQPIAKPTPVHTPPTHAAPGDGSVRREGTEPVAWGVANGSRVLATSIYRNDAVDMQSEFACDTEIVPLYREPTLTDEEREAIEWAAREADQWEDDEPVPHQHAATLRGLLERIGGGR